MALIYADENLFGPASSNKMPVLRLLGDGHKQMLRDCILEVGSYGHICDRTLQQSIPRAGANLLNPDSETGPQHFAIPYQ